MRIHQFELLDDCEKEEVVWKFGTFIANFDEGNDLCDVYELFDFYVGFCYKLDKDEKATIITHIYADQLPELINLN
jgi:hypothetical protein